jgi:hypothetical protein
VGAMHIDPKEVVNVAKVTHGELAGERINEGLKQVGGVSSEDNVVNVEKKVGEVGTTVENKEGGVTFGRLEPKCMEEFGKPKEPSAGRLLKPIERLVEAANMCRTGRIHKAGGLLAVDGLGQIAVKESIFDVHLSNGPPICRRNAEDDTDGSRLDHGTERLPIVDTGLLSEAAHHPPSLVPRQSAVGMEFVNSSSIAACQCGSLSAARYEDGTGEVVVET